MGGGIAKAQTTEKWGNLIRTQLENFAERRSHWSKFPDNKPKEGVCKVRNGQGTNIENTPGNFYRTRKDRRLRATPGKGYERSVLEGGHRRSYRCMERGSKSAAHRDMQIRTMMRQRSHLSDGRKHKNRKQDAARCGGDGGDPGNCGWWESLDGCSRLESRQLSLVQLGCVCHLVARQFNPGCYFSGAFTTSSSGRSEAASELVPGLRGGQAPRAAHCGGSQQKYRP